MKVIDFALCLFTDARDRERSERAIHVLLHALTCVACEWLSENPTPWPADSQLFVATDNRKRARGRTWQDVSSIARAVRTPGGQASTAGLACWRIAHEWHRGVDARPVLLHRGARAYEIAVRYPDGTIWRAPNAETYEFGGYRPIRIDVDLFQSEADRERSERALHFFLHALVCVDYEWLRYRPQTPALYTSGIRYEHEAPGQEEWQDIPTMLLAQNYQRKRTGDCEDLACARVAEDWRRRCVSRPYVRYRLLTMPDGRTQMNLYHILSQRPDGTIEDPSKQLGMGAASAEAKFGLVGEAFDPNESASRVYRPGSHGPLLDCVGETRVITDGRWWETDVSGYVGPFLTRAEGCA